MSKKSQLSKEEILHLAKLANLTLSEEEIRQYQAQLVETLEYIENLNEIDTKKITPTSSTTNLTNVYFEDGMESGRTLTVGEAVAHAGKKRDSLFTVSRIL